MKPITLLRKKAKLGERGFPRATLAFYGPDERKATKAVLGIFLRDDEEDLALYRYFNEEKDVRYDVVTQNAILSKLSEEGVKTLAMVEWILRCPHEEGIDYPEGEECPKCPYWKGRDGYAGALE